jgi:hypothetical protein
MTNRTTSFVSVVTLIIYGTLALVSVPLHFHQDVPLNSGSGQHAITQHDDALHCTHRAIEGHNDCTLCSIGSYTAGYRVIAVVPQLNILLTDQVTGLLFYEELSFSSAHSRRGPPALFA